MVLTYNIGSAISVWENGKKGILQFLFLPKICMYRVDTVKKGIGSFVKSPHKENPQINIDSTSTQWTLQSGLN